VATRKVNKLPENMLHLEEVESLIEYVPIYKLFCRVDKLLVMITFFIVTKNKMLIVLVVHIFHSISKNHKTRTFAEFHTYKLSASYVLCFKSSRVSTLHNN